MTELRSLWSDLLTELDVRAPVTREAIRPPRAGGAAAIQESLGIELTEEVQTWFALHDGAGWDFGTGSVMPGEFLMGVEDVIKTTTMWRDICAEFGMEPGGTDLTSGDPDVAGNLAGTWMPAYLAITDDTCGGNSFVDLRNGPLRGCVRAYMDEMADNFQGRIAESLTDLLQRILTSIRTGAPCGPGNQVPAFRDGVLEWAET